MGAHTGVTRQLRWPSTASEWQEAVDLAAGLRMIADCKMYGLLEGGGDIDVARCDAMLARGAERGVRPSRPVVELALGMVAAINAEAAERG